MTSTSAQGRAGDARGASRASIYLAAGLYHDGTRLPITIRNISRVGALVEGPVIPEAGALVQLVRGGLIVHGLVAWAPERKCGLKFSGNVDVQQWRATPGNSEQQRVDEVVRLVKAGAVPLPVPGLHQGGTVTAGREEGAELAQHLKRTAELLEALGGVLAGDPEIVRRHGPSLQKLDIAIQMIAAAESIVGDPGSFEVDAMKLAALGRSADQALHKALSCQKIAC
jgi:hypothetical protein